MEFFEFVTPKEALQTIEANIDLKKKTEKINVTKGLDRVVAFDVLAAEDLPAFTKSTMDGYAIQAGDTFGASEQTPQTLDIIGEVEMGVRPNLELKAGQAVEIPTGGMLPDGADAVVMIERVETKADEVKVYTSVSPGANIVRKGSDILQGEVVVSAGHCLRPQDIGALAGLGITEIEAYKKPKVGIISTGNELISLGEELNPSQTRDINTYSLTSLVEELGAIPIQGGIIEDSNKALKQAVDELAPQVDFLLISGGSSVGARDVTYEVLEELGTEDVLIHGIAIKPGKPTLFTMLDELPVYGLPGHPVSVMVTFNKFVAPYINQKMGVIKPPSTVKAEFSQNISSDPGREDYLRVTVEKENNNLIARPVRGESSLIMTMVEADGLVRVPLSREGLTAGEEVKVELF
ncbi:gephyrin-like molybdotransferase Glp [Sporohalobacter salinus]|uniref:molybdopterin molybdotransferase MoeA n=1 Tax=Sporohalobacter salinus TaxID=1494606 RepID=UPI0019616A33|nr:gephyrin-like molybdotransferase Glp [Sporohalobacter salinus]MBM7624536.1 molybdopterin molybdotransferase [Sporohalobacter salinus]